MAELRAKQAKPEPRLFTRVFRLPVETVPEKVNDCAVVVTTEALHRGLRATGEPFISHRAVDGGHEVITWAVEVEENVR